MHRILHTLTLAAALVCLGGPRATAAPAEEAAPPTETNPSKACDGQGQTGWMLHQTVLGLTNNLGAVSETKVGWCRPLVKREGLLWKMSQLEPGAFAFVTPSFVRSGGYFELVPLSFLVLRFAASGVYYWPLPGFRVANYFDAGSYDFRWPSNGITNDVRVDKGQGGGLNLSATVVLRAAIGLKKMRHGELELIVLNAFATEYWYFGHHSHYYNQRADVVMARSDVALANNAALLLAFPLTARLGMRVGATDSLTYLPKPGFLAWHQVGGLIMFPIRGVGRRFSDFTAFTRITAFTSHHTRQLSFRWNFLVGVEFSLRLY